MSGRGERGKKMSSTALGKHVPAEPLSSWRSASRGLIQGSSEQVMKLESQR